MGSQTSQPQEPFQQMFRQGSLAGTDALIGTGIATIVIGILAVVAPLATGVVFDMIFGALLIGAGIVELIDALRAGTWQRAVPLALAGLVTLAAGALYIALPVLGLIALTVVLIAYLVFTGALRIVMAFQHPRGAPGKSWAFVSGAVSLVLAYLAIAQMPNVSTWLIGTIIGVSLIFVGIARISFARGLRHTVDLAGTPQGRTSDEAANEAVLHTERARS